MSSLHNGHIWLDPTSGVLYGRDTDDDPWEAIAYEGGAVGSAEIVITEDASGAAGTYTGSVTVPGGATIIDWAWTWIADWSYNPAVAVNLGVEGDLTAFLDGEGNGTVGMTKALSRGQLNGGADFSQMFSAVDREIIATVVVSDTNPPGTGILRILVTWAKATPVAATFEPAA